ncbi:hypothetical protein SM0020_09880 [Sinorhizobium meliloti CCNWSX0020]|uniref:Uncharacterized protein n=1 Tax=Sinorhizobium meliloti CCNWSX0020 TaxID=1107881 RepID=H0FXQ8_RHIML|nr:hypothetical protein SM0020_09880 [Sinorhizobium meliloti CCNWSX0020]
MRTHGEEQHVGRVHRFLIVLDDPNEREAAGKPGSNLPVARGDENPGDVEPGADDARHHRFGDGAGADEANTHRCSLP